MAIIFGEQAKKLFGASASATTVAAGVALPHSGRAESNTHSQIRCIWDYQYYTGGPGGMPEEYETVAGNYILWGSERIPKGSRIIDAMVMSNGKGGDVGCTVQLGIIQGGKPPFTAYGQTGTESMLTNAVDTNGDAEAIHIMGSTLQNGGVVVTQDAQIVLKVAVASMYTENQGKLTAWVMYMSV